MLESIDIPMPEIGFYVGRHRAPELPDLLGETEQQRRERRLATIEEEHQAAVAALAGTTE